MNEQWQELKETIIELRDNDGTGTQQEVCKFLANLMDVLEKGESLINDDAISRQAAIDALKNLEDLQGRNVFTKNGLYPWNVIAQLPSVTPKQRTGRWEEIKSLWGGKWEMIDNYKCSVCGELEASGNDYNYCPHCGCAMKGKLE